MIPLRYSFQSYYHRFVGIDNTSISGIAFSNTAAGFPRGNLLGFYKALLLASEFQLSTSFFHGLFKFFIIWFNEEDTPYLPGTIELWFSNAHFCFACRFDASDMWFHISGHTLSGLEVVCFLVSLPPDNENPSGGLSFNTINLVNHVRASDLIILILHPHSSNHQYFSPTTHPMRKMYSW